MANPVAAYAYAIDPPPRRTSSAPTVIEAEPLRPGPSRARPAALRLVHDATFERVRDPETAGRGRPRLYDITQRDAGFGAEAEEALRDAGRRRAPATLAFTAQQIAQEKLSPGAYFENYKPALAAYGAAARHGETAAPRLLTLSV